MSLSPSTLQQKRWRKELRRRAIHDRMGRNSRLPANMRRELSAAVGRDKYPHPTASMRMVDVPVGPIHLPKMVRHPVREAVLSKLGSFFKRPKKLLPQKVVAS